MCTRGLGLLGEARAAGQRLQMPRRRLKNSLPGLSPPNRARVLRVCLGIAAATYCCVNLRPCAPRLHHHRVVPGGLHQHLFTADSVPQVLLPASAAPPSLDDGRHRTHASGAGNKVYADILGNTTLLRLLEVHFAHEYVLMRLRGHYASASVRLRLRHDATVYVPALALHGHTSL